MDLDPGNRAETVRLPRSLPRGRSRLPREMVLLSQRARLIEAAVDVIGGKGYPASTVGDIIGAAGVSRSTFYEQFRDREDCFIVAYEEGARSLFDHVAAAAREKPGGQVERLQSGVRAFLNRLADDPAYARVSAVEVLAAGPAAATSRELVHERYAALLRKWHGQVRIEQPLVPEMPAEVFDCAVGGVSDLVAGHVRKGNTQALPRLAPVIVTLLLNVAAAPTGRELAAALSRSRARRSP
jgi:AcrR family transcriptional regulator